MQDRRRHQRVRFGQSPAVLIGFNAACADGSIENLSSSGMMLRSDVPLTIGRPAGVEFSLFGSPLLDVPVTIVSCVGNLYGVRFQSGPISQITINDAIAAMLATGHASVLSVHEIEGRKVLRVVGGLNGALRKDFIHALTHNNIHEIDVSAVTAVELAGLSLCVVAMVRHQVNLGAQSECFLAAWNKAVSGRLIGAEE